MTRSESKDPGVEMALRLRLVSEVHDKSLHGHLDRVAHYACNLARRLELPSELLYTLAYAAPLHDIGKLSLSPALLAKPGGLTEAEMEEVKKHTVLGHKILCGSRWPVMQSAARIALSHHENWDGSGYPFGLMGEKIPIDAQIVSISDVYDALHSKRTYKPAWDTASVVTEMKRLRGIKFDPTLLDLFLADLPQPIVSAA